MTPIYACWLNQVEIWFNRITQQALRRGTFSSVKELVEKIDHYVQNSNMRSRSSGPPQQSSSLESNDCVKDLRIDDRARDAYLQLPRLDLAVAKIAGFSWHCLRHTFASRLVMAGVDLRAVQELLGHKTIAMSVRYSHLAPKHTLAAVERLDIPAETPTDTATDTEGSRQVASEVQTLQQVIQ